MNDKKLPDKAIDVIDETGAAKKIISPKSKKSITEKDIEETISRMETALNKIKSWD